MQLHHVALALGVMLLLAKIGEESFRRVGIPSFIAPIIVGLLVGPFGIGLIEVGDLPFIALFTILGIDFLLFIAGVEELAKITLMEKNIKRMLFSSLILLLSSTTMVFAVMHLLLSIGFFESIIVGVVMGIVSLGPLVRALTEAGLLSTDEGRCLIVITAFSEAEGIIFFNLVTRGPSLMLFVYTILAVIGFYFFGKYLFVHIIRIVERYISAREAPFAIIIALILLTGRLAEILGFNAAIVALGLGIFSSTYLLNRPDILDRLRAFTFGFFEPLFFIGLGLYVSYIGVMDFILGVIIAAVASIAKIVSLRYLTHIKSLNILSLSLAKGGVDAALLLIAYNAGLLSPSTYTFVLVSIILMALVFSLPVRRHILASAPIEARKLTVADIVGEKIYASPNTSLDEIISVLEKMNGVVIVDENMRPIGIVTSADLIYVDPAKIRSIKVSEVMRTNVPIVYEGEHLDENVIELVSSNQVVAVIDREGRLKGTLYPRHIIEWLITSGRLR